MDVDVGLGDRLRGIFHSGVCSAYAYLELLRFMEYASSFKIFSEFVNRETIPWINHVNVSTSSQGKKRTLGIIRSGRSPRIYKNAINHKGKTPESITNHNKAVTRL